MDLLLSILATCWTILVESAPYVLFGFLAAGILKAFLPDELVARHLGGTSTRAVIKASLLGIPLPLCSCGVIPAAIGLRKQGAGKGASTAFLISTPESGVDSIAITWALLDPLMTIARPIAAFLTATTAGVLINRMPDKVEKLEADDSQGAACASSCCGSSPAETAKPKRTRLLLEGLDYAFGELLKDIGSWLLLGILIAGMISALLPNDFFVNYIGSGFGSLLVMLLVGIPLYICASASTPIAAALILKGVSPGAALVFLLAGPATNAATITVVRRFFGTRVTIVYVVSIACCSLLLGWLLNLIYAFSGIDITRWIEVDGHPKGAILGTLAAILLLALILRAYLPRRQVNRADNDKSQTLP